ncbi:MAG: acyltransferase [Prevotella sp.]|nr:acyltransferase [Prevotella sp.]
MNERINWMDWAKFLSVALVIPVHIPHALGAQPVTWFEVFLLACLMFNAGYLKKERTNLKEEVKKYGYQLGIPYIIYNILFYPYWLIRFYSEHDTMPTLAESLRPIYGALLLQANNNFAEELNPVTWFIAALFIMHLLLDLSLKIKHGSWLMGGLGVAGMGIYVAHRAGYVPAHFVVIGIAKSLVFYYMGFLCRKYHAFETCDFKKDAIKFVITLIVSIVLFNYHAGVENNFTLHMISYFPAVLFGLLAFIYFCKLLNSIHSKAIVNYSNGTMVFIGLHWMLTGIVRYGILKPIFHVSTDYIYTPLEAYGLGLLVTILLYPLILFFQAKMPWMLGKRYIT